VHQKDAQLLLADNFARNNGVQTHNMDAEERAGDWAWARHP